MDNNIKVKLGILIAFLIIGISTIIFLKLNENNNEINKLKDK